MAPYSLHSALCLTWAPREQFATWDTSIHLEQEMTVGWLIGDGADGLQACIKKDSFSLRWEIKFLQSGAGQRQKQTRPISADRSQILILIEGKKVTVFFTTLKNRKGNILIQYLHYMTKSMWTPARRPSHSKIMGINMELFPPLLL
jgi:hypothetical protein